MTCTDMYDISVSVAYHLVVKYDMYISVGVAYRAVVE